MGYFLPHHCNLTVKIYLIHFCTIHCFRKNWKGIHFEFINLLYLILYKSLMWSSYWIMYTRMSYWKSEMDRLSYIHRECMTMLLNVRQWTYWMSTFNGIVVHSTRNVRQSIHFKLSIRHNYKLFAIWKFLYFN